MRINNLDNFYDKISITYLELEEQLKTFDLIFYPERNQKIEWKLPLPLLCTPFYFYIERYKRIPNQEEYTNFYIQYNEVTLKGFKLNAEEQWGLKARLYRAYPSFVRDFHFGLYLKSKNIFTDVFYNIEVDTKFGIDIVVQNNQNSFGLKLYTNTPIAQEAKQMKDFKPKKKVDFKCIDVPLEFKGSHQIGKFFLYGERELEIVLERLKSFDNFFVM